MSATQATTGITYRYFALSETETLLTLPVYLSVKFFSTFAICAIVHMQSLQKVMAWYTTLYCIQQFSNIPIANNIHCIQLNSTQQRITDAGV